MQMSERQWRTLSLLERLGRGEVTVGEVAGSVGRSKRQVQRMRKRFASSGAAGLVHGDAGRSPKHRTSPEVREKVLMLRRGKYDGFNDQHFTEKLVEVEGLELTRDGRVRVALREEGLQEPHRASPRARHRHPQTA
jgi:transposase